MADIEPIAYGFAEWSKLTSRAQYLLDPKRYEAELNGKKKEKRRVELSMPSVPTESKVNNQIQHGSSSLQEAHRCKRVKLFH